MSMAQGAISAGNTGSNGRGWVVYLPLLCIVPAAAAFRAVHAAAIGVLGGALLSFAGFAWSGGGAILPAATLTWPLFLAAGLLFAAIRSRIHREREASLLHRRTRSNRAELETSEVCGCIYCERIYSPTEIVQWIDDKGGETAECPHCGVDAVVGSASGIPITPSVLRRAHARWFLVGT